MLINDILNCLVKFVEIIVPILILLILVKLFIKVPREVFRKTLHMVAIFVIIVIVHLSNRWEVAACVFGAISIIVYPIFLLIENRKWFGEFFIQRKSGEIKNSLLLLFGANTVLVSIFWGYLNLKYIVIVSVLMWGIGDAFAALIGKHFGKHHVHLPFADTRKTWEGSFSMMCSSLIMGSIVMANITELSIPTVLITTFVTSIVGAYTELISHNGDDTITVPLMNSIVLLLFHTIL